MERTKFKKGPSAISPTLSTFASQLVGRMQLMTGLGLQYGGKRDMYQTLGYPTILTFKDYALRYTRQDIAKAIIDRPVKATWQGPIDLVESNKPKDTIFEKTWDDLNRRLGIKSRLSRLDRLVGIGRYGVLLLGLDDVKKREDFVKPVAAGKRKLLYLKPFSEQSAQISKWVENPNDARYGKPLIYAIEISNEINGVSTNFFVDVHHSRIIHVIDEPLESEIYGIPRLEAIFNRLIDLDKVVGGDAEMFWRGARPGYEGKLDPEYTMTDEMRESLQDQITEFENNLRRILINEGVELKALEQQISDPSHHVDIILTMISAVTGIPKRILSGSERGELASTQDSSEWKDYVQARRSDYAEPNIVRPLVVRLIELTILPKPNEDYTVKWNDLYSLSEKAKVEIGKGRANALREYTYSPMSQAVVPPDAFLEFFLGLTKEQITLIQAMRDEVISEEELDQKIIDLLEPKETSEKKIETVIDE